YPNAGGILLLEIQGCAAVERGPNQSTGSAVSIESAALRCDQRFRAIAGSSLGTRRLWRHSNAKRHTRVRKARGVEGTRAIIVLRTRPAQVMPQSRAVCGQQSDARPWPVAARLQNLETRGVITARPPGQLDLIAIEHGCRSVGRRCGTRQG